MAVYQLYPAVVGNSHQEAPPLNVFIRLTTQQSAWQREALFLHVSFIFHAGKGKKGKISLLLL